LGNYYNEKGATPKIGRGNKGPSVLYGGKSKDSPRQKEHIERKNKWSYQCAIKRRRPGRGFRQKGGKIDHKAFKKRPPKTTSLRSRRILTMDNTKAKTQQVQIAGQVVGRFENGVKDPLEGPIPISKKGSREIKINFVIEPSSACRGYRGGKSRSVIRNRPSRDSQLSYEGTEREHLRLQKGCLTL